MVMAFQALSNDSEGRNEILSYHSVEGRKYCSKRKVSVTLTCDLLWTYESASSQIFPWKNPSDHPLYHTAFYECYFLSHLYQHSSSKHQFSLTSVHLLSYYIYLHCSNKQLLINHLRSKVRETRNYCKRRFE